MRTIESITTYNSGTFPNTLGVNSTGPSTKDGTELHANIFNDYVGVFPQALLNDMGMTPDGNAETATASQQLDALKGLISRLASGWGVIGRAAADTVHDVTLSVGAVPDSTRAYMLRLTAEITKQIDAAWTAGTNLGGLMGGTLTANTEYGMYLIYNPTTRVLDAGFSVYTGAGVPTFLPAGYTVYQMVDWVKTDGTSNIIQYDTADYGAGKVIKHIKTPVLDIDLANTLTTARRLDVIGVPNGFECMVNGEFQIYDASANTVAYVCYPGETDSAVDGTVKFTNLSGLANNAYLFTELNVRTNLSKQIATRGNAATIDSYTASVKYFIWNRF